MATIGQRTFAVTGANKYLSLANEEFSRTFQFGNNWKWIRVVYLCGLTSTGANISPRLVTSVQNTSLRGRGYNSANTLSSFSVMHGHALESGGTAWTYTLNGGNVYYVQALTHGRLLQRYNGASSALTNVASGGQNAINCSTGTNNTLSRRSIYGVDFWRPNAPGGHVTNLQIKTTCPNGTTGKDIDQSYWLLRDAAANGTFVNVTSTTGGATQMAPTPAEGTRTWDSLNIFWDQSAAPLEIYGIYVVRFW